MESIHLHEEIYDTHNIPDQCHSADCPETPVNTSNVFIRHQIPLLPVTPQAAYR